MSSSKSSHNRYSFDITKAVQSVNDIDMNTAVQLGGPKKYAEFVGKQAKQNLKKEHGVSEFRRKLPSDRKERRMEQNKRSSQATLKRKEAELAAQVEMHKAMEVQIESLRLVHENLNNNIASMAQNERDIINYKKSKMNGDRRRKWINFQFMFTFYF